ncbi:glycoside hydrolase family 76 protein [Microbacterium sp. cx-59]|uniref:glycoside hydrolase family 76 protein n=1 Tax=Microbacterium sp. cx-59 TaxID=2891207 RepID=UPI001E2D361A|nr:glycoside hydrolase family 76 protein [Microbacterium sp. cx-59]MCC4908808.1 glycoside hydrolase [Microbacterium sp. cx-59]
MSVWDARADVAQLSIDRFFGAGERRMVHTTYPPRLREPFHYWWLAHLVDVRLDAFARTGASAWAGNARRVARSIRRRNHGSLFNDYFDDMLWYALALDRMHTLTGDERAGENARALWEHCVQHGWNDTHGASMAWRKQQLDYKNTPANGPFVILSARLGARGDARALEYAGRGFEWLTTRMRGADGMVLDGVNRAGDGRVDGWRFTYNQGVYIGAASALFEATGDRALLGRASETASAAIAQLTAGAVFVGEDDGGDAGLFRGIFYRYLGGLLPHMGADAAAPLADFVRGSTDQLWAHGLRDGRLLAGDDWREPATGRIALSTQLSAVMALEVRAALERSELTPRESAAR